jgi:hypothetical protein
MTRLRPRPAILLGLLAGCVAACVSPAAALAVAPSGGRPTVSGTAQQGDTLTLTQGTWANTPTSVTDQWQDCDSAGANCTAIPGATAATYPLTASDVGHTIVVLETATNADGAATGASTPTAVVVSLPAPVNTVAPAISGTAQQGQTLSASTGTWSNTPITFGYQWERCTTTCAAITGATGSTYTLMAADVGATIKVDVSATNAGGTGGPATSVATAAIIALAPVNVQVPGLSGTAQQGQTLTATTGVWNNAPTSFTYQWERCTTACTAISGATATTYVLAAADVGATIEVQVTAVNTGGSAIATSLPTATATPPPPTSVTAPLITGTLQQGSVLTEHHGTWMNTPTSFAYEWMRCDAAGVNCAPIAGATAPTYTLTATDVGATMVVREMASNAGGSGTAASALTGTVMSPANVIPVPTIISAPGLTGTAEQGQTLRESHGNWNFNPSSYDYQWVRCPGAACTNIPGANGPTYTLTAADVGQTIAVLEAASNGGGGGNPAASPRTAVVKATSSVSLVVSPAQLVAGQRATLIATVSSGSGNARPSGSVAFLNGQRPIPGCGAQAVNAGGQSATVVCQASFPAGAARLLAAYQPATAAAVTSSASAAQPIAVGRDSTSISLQASKRVALRKRVTLTATVISPLGNVGPFTPTGSVEFRDGDTPIPGCDARLVRASIATCTVAYRAVGRHEVSARYAGDPNFAGSASPARAIQAVRGGATGPRGAVTSIVQWKFAYHPSYTRVMVLRATGILQGMTLRLTCTGRGCPFARRATSTRASCAGVSRSSCSTSSSIDLSPAFSHRRLRAGARITIRITRRNWVGKYYSFEIVARKPPSVALSCLAPGSRLPGVGC